MDTGMVKQERIGARVPRHVYEKLNRAAELTGATVNQFLVQSALKEAQAIIEREEKIALTSQDWNWLLNLLENPHEPNPQLTSALKHYHQCKQNDADSSFNWQP